MTGNSSLFTIFQSHPSTSIATLADESKSCVLGLDTINLIPLVFKKGMRCYCPTLRRYFVFIDVTFFETTPFSLSSTVISQGEDDDLLEYTISSPTPAPVPVPIEPPITQVYSRS